MLGRRASRLFGASLLAAAISVPAISTSDAFADEWVIGDDVQLSVTAPTNIYASVDMTSGNVIVPDITIRNTSTSGTGMSGVNMQFAKEGLGTWTLSASGADLASLSAGNETASFSGPRLEHINDEVTISTSTTLSGDAARAAANGRIASTTFKFKSLRKQVNLDPNGGSFADGRWRDFVRFSADDDTLVYGTVTAPQRDGMVFAGWNSAADGSGKWVSADEMGSCPSGTVLFAQWKKGPVAFAVYSADDNSLDFYKRDEAPKAGDTFEGKTATDVYADIEVENYDPSPYHWDKHKDDIVSVAVVDDGIAPRTLKGWFSQMKNLTSCDVRKLDTSKAQSFQFTFQDDSKLESIQGIESLDTSASKSFRSTFSSDKALKSLDLSEWKTGNAEDMSLMFYDCESLTGLGSLSGWDTSKVKDFKGTFQWCAKLENLSLNGWNAQAAEDMSLMFKGCNTLKSIEGVESLSCPNNKTLEGTFEHCRSLTSLSVATWDVSQVETLYNTFSDCTALSSFNAQGWNLAKCKDYRDALSYNTHLQNLDGVKGWNTAAAEDLTNAFAHSYWTNVDGLSDWDVSNVTVMNGAFDYCTRITTISGLSNWNTSKVVDAISMFADCQELKSLDAVRAWNLPQLKTAKRMFARCYMLEDVSALSEWNTPALTSVEMMFDSDNNLKSANGVEFLGTAQIENASQLFSGCSNLAEIDALAQCNASNIETMSAMLSGCWNLENVEALSDWDVSSCKDMSKLFYGCWGLNDLSAIEHWDTSSVENVDMLFQECHRIKSLDLSGWDMSKVESMNDWLALDRVHRVLGTPIASNTLEKIVLPSSLKWAGEKAYLPTPCVDGADGSWYALSDGKVYKASEVPSGKADTYYATKSSRDAAYKELHPDPKPGDKPSTGDKGDDDDKENSDNK